MQMDVDVCVGEPRAPVHAVDANDAGDLQRQLNALLTLTPLQLRAQWHRDYRHRAPPSISTQKLARAIAFRLQAAHYGIKDTVEPGRGLSRISALTDGLGGPTVLRRLWEGEDHEVIKEGDTYLYAGKTYASLSAVARAITGTRWNGWAFFGLKNPAAKTKGGVDAGE